jgi:hypothetical protein
LVNQVGKSGVRNSFQEDLIEGSREDLEYTEVNKIPLPIPASKIKTLNSPRSSSLDDDLPKRNISSTFKDIDELLTKLENKRQVESIILSPLTSYEVKSFERPDDVLHENGTPKKDYNMTSPLAYKPSTGHFEKRAHFAESRDISDRPITRFDENKTDSFGWENKGFAATQRKPHTNFKEELSPINKSDSNVISNYIKTSDDVYIYNKPKIEVKSSLLSPDSASKPTFDNAIGFDVRLNLKPASYHSISPEGDSTLTAISEVVAQPSDYIPRDFSESWKIENNNSISESFNLSPSNKYTFRSNDTSNCLENSSFRNIRKYSGSPISRLNDTFSKLNDLSALETHSKPEASKCETEQSSDLCFISSSMSFSFDPSVDEQPSSKPATFNSSDTLCQLTSLDQISTPISPKVRLLPFQ